MMRWRSAATRVSVVASLGFLRSSISTVDLSLIVCALFLAAQAAARAPRRRFNVCWPGPGSGSATCLGCKNTRTTLFALIPGARLDLQAHGPVQPAVDDLATY